MKDFKDLILRFLIAPNAVSHLLDFGQVKEFHICVCCWFPQKVRFKLVKAKAFELRVKIIFAGRVKYPSGLLTYHLARKYST